MQTIKLPHLAPVRFAQEVLLKEEKLARVSLSFGMLPSLAMMVEAAAQSSAAFRVNDRENAYLVSLKGVVLHEKASSENLVAEIIDAHRLDKMRYVEFKIFEEDLCLASGTLVIAVQ
jgi:hypothetical protein